MSPLICLLPVYPLNFASLRVCVCCAERVRERVPHTRRSLSLFLECDAGLMARLSVVKIRR